VRIRRRVDARANLRKAIERGPTSLAIALPATKVPPQKNAVRSNLR